jgi:hypothetical protein
MLAAFIHFCFYQKTLMMKGILQISVLIFAFGCSQVSNERNSNTQLSDSNQAFLRPEIELIGYKPNEDSLFIVSSEDWVYYPFGKYQKYREFHLKFLQGKSHEIDSIFESFPFFTVRSGLNTIQFIESDETMKLEMIYAEILDRDLVIHNEIKIGQKNQISY